MYLQLIVYVKLQLHVLRIHFIVKLTLFSYSITYTYGTQRQCTHTHTHLHTHSHTHTYTHTHTHTYTHSLYACTHACAGDQECWSCGRAELSCWESYRMVSCELLAIHTEHGCILFSPPSSYNYKSGSTQHLGFF